MSVFTPQIPSLVISLVSTQPFSSQISIIVVQREAYKEKSYLESHFVKSVLIQSSVFGDREDRHQAILMSGVYHAGT